MITYDDGIAKVYSTQNIALPGEMPESKLVFKTRFCFSYYELGITRFYYAMKNGQNISAVIESYFDTSVAVNDVVVLEDGAQYIVRMVQPTINENGLRIMRISLERIEQNYEFAEID
ncbi:hypothetical protein IMSAG250_00720 [Clostridiales bacterium]|nr:hypothetical protein IMSAG250_00720 [Clostridiales bacterium]